MTFWDWTIGRSSKYDSKVFIWPSILVTEVLVYSSYGIFINLSRTDGNLEYHSSSIWFSVEVLKLCLALCLAWPEILNQVPMFSGVKRVLPFSIPALCYCVNNNLSVYMQDQMDPATYQVLSNLKIASTAIFYRLIIKRRLMTLQWVSLGVLMFAGGLNSYTGLKAKSRSLQDIHISALGVAMSAIYCSVSGFSGVYTEYILKKDAVIPLALQNCYMYIFGVILNGLLMFYQSGDMNIYHSFTKYTWAAVISQAFNGLAMSFIMKHSSNITRLLVISSAVPVTATLTMIVFNMKAGLDFFVVVFLVVLALCMYNSNSTGKKQSFDKEVTV
ncbi:hypothetical protein EGW08_013516 [Elysia chlorotica]|uniref:Sugar phosphate transporter domain-containing protein n=1 Tax=Elysia chlorotica TaxID=188477 RepID=A0A3S0ZIR7_ELYCH|nr:hypothetical protein EGW08_013516 [Elysia chlorotica]